MRISAVSISNFKRIHDVKITPDADRAIILIGGKNGQGKSSTLDALTAAFGGKKAQPSDAVRHGAEHAEIEVKLDGGLTIKRVIDASGESTLEVRDSYGAVKAPQAVLDKIVSGRFLDPLAFLALPAKDQRAALMRLIDGADRIAGLNEKRARAFDRRTEVGRDLTKAEGELARLPEPKLESPIDVAALTAEKNELAKAKDTLDSAIRTREQCERETLSAKGQLARILDEKRRIDAEIERLKGLSVELGTKSAAWAEDVSKCNEVEAAATKNVDELHDRWEELAPRRAHVDAELARANEHNRAVFAAEAQAKRKSEVQADVEKLTKERDDLTKLLATIDERKASILSAAKLPVEGLGVADDGIELNGVPFAQASGAEKLRVALALAMAAAPELGDVWVKDGALLDDESLELVLANASAAGKRVWLERVGTRDPGVIVIADGKVAQP